MCSNRGILSLGSETPPILLFITVITSCDIPFRFFLLLLCLQLELYVTFLYYHMRTTFGVTCRMKRPSCERTSCQNRVSLLFSGVFANSFCNPVQFTVTRIAVIFRYPDRVPLTHFVHRAKNVFSMWA
jgi:hypothetical protein